MTRSGWRRWVALVGSLGLYFIPLVAPHGVWLVGVVLGRSNPPDPAFISTA